MASTLGSSLGQALGIAGYAAAFGIGTLFLTAGLAKLRSRRVFPGVVANYRLLPPALVGVVATLLPPAEVVIGACLIVGIGPAAIPAAGLLLVFAAAMAVNIRRGRSHIDCGCGRSDLRQTLSGTLVLRNVVLAALLLPTLGQLPSPGSAGWWIGLASGSALYLLTLLVNALAALAKGPLAIERNMR
ncbi:MauE/DoxX family redox-associated membrane protein [Novosphingobium taihuense]|uniref:Methylamine utilization protein MauE n=1 Tax=Novosphingobium taihuense TaxID=260085 RepID=A0A7W7AAT4_9SPHN|nr:MauE/DoxX family redox-associated membrane protein [Novosphingobium taihuense]MBB4613584.1 putative membrane protein YphA (DoxX/SURF4 family) [Novosphingobium taihuense]